jgi:hypothetical protein
MFSDLILPCLVSGRLTQRSRFPVRQEALTEHEERSGVTDPERLTDIEQKLRCWGYLSHYPDAERDVAWLLDQLAERNARIAELEARLARTGTR